MPAAKSVKKSATVKRAAAGGEIALYRKLALALPHVVENSHMGAADFRIEVAGKRRIFATLAFENRGLGTVMLDTEQQAAFLSDAAQWFVPAPGGWGRLGATLVHLDAPESVLAGALETAHCHILGKMLAKRSAAKSSRKS
jgi:hypothetical protein